MPAAWMARAASAANRSNCLPNTGVTAASVSKARAACSRCQVRGECLELRVHHPDTFGTWGGTTERQRRKVRSVA